MCKTGHVKWHVTVKYSYEFGPTTIAQMDLAHLVKFRRSALLSLVLSQGVCCEKTIAPDIKRNIKINHLRVFFWWALGNLA